MAYRVFSVRMSSEVFDLIKKYNSVRQLFGLSKVTTGEYISEAVKRAITEDLKNMDESAIARRQAAVSDLSSDLLNSSEGC